MGPAVLGPAVLYVHFLPNHHDTTPDLPKGLVLTQRQREDCHVDWDKTGHSQTVLTEMTHATLPPTICCVCGAGGKIIINAHTYTNGLAVRTWLLIEVSYIVPLTRTYFTCIHECHDATRLGWQREGGFLYLTEAVQLQLIDRSVFEVNSHFILSQVYNNHTHSGTDDNSPSV